MGIDIHIGQFHVSFHVGAMVPTGAILLLVFAVWKLKLAVFGGH